MDNITLEYIPIDRRVSIKKLPPELHRLLEEALLLIRNSLEECNLVGVFASGSWVRGEMNSGSDVDFFLTINGVEDRTYHKVGKVIQQLKEKFTPKLIADIDIKLIDLQSDTSINKARKIIIIADGCNVWGQDISLEEIKSENLLDIIQAFTDIYQLRLKDSNLYDPDLHKRFRNRRMLAKLILRWYRLLTIESGGSISASTKDIDIYLAGYFPESKDDFRNLYHIYNAQKISDDECAVLVQKYNEVIERLQDKGINTSILQLKNKLH